MKQRQGAPKRLVVPNRLDFLRRWRISWRFTEVHVARREVLMDGVTCGGRGDWLAVAWTVLHVAGGVRAEVYLTPPRWRISWRFRLRRPARQSCLLALP